MALRAMAGHRLRTLLTMLGIIIGIASVVSMVALGEGSRQRVLKDISAMGTNTIDIFPGKGFGDRQAGRIRTLVPADAEALEQLSYVDSVSPSVSTSVTLRRGNTEATANVNGVGESFFRVKGYTMARGQAFDNDGVRRLTQEAVIDPATRKALFTQGENPVGQVIFLGNVPVRVTGVTSPQESGFMQSDSLNVWVPYTTAMRRLIGQPNVRNITVRISDSVPSVAAEQGITKLIAQRHGAQDFFVRNSDSIRQTIESTTKTMTLLISLDRRDLAGRRRHRGDEHHAGVGDRAHAGDRRAHGGGRAAVGHPAPVPHRGGAGLPDRRGARRRAVAGDRIWLRQVRWRFQIDLFGVVDRGSVRGVLVDRRGVRLPAGAQCGQAGSSGRAVPVMTKKGRRSPIMFPVFKPAIVAMAVTLLSACATQSAYQQPKLAMPAQWQQQQQPSPQGSSPLQADSGNAVPADTQALSPWWLTLGDATLTQLIQDAQARNNDLAQAAIKVRRAQLVAGQAASDQLPRVNVGGNTSASQRLEGGATSRQNAVTGSVSWELDLWGRLASLRSAADWEAQATEEDRQAAAMALVGTVANLYWQVAYLNQRVDASLQSIEYARQTLKLVEAQYGVGAASGLEIAQATQALAAQEASHTQWLQQRVQARNALAILFDQPPGVAVNEALRLPDGLLPAVQPGLPASLLTRRPDLRASELRLRKSLAAVDATRTSYYPTLTLTGSVGSSSSALADVLRNPIGTLGAGLVLPFVQWRDMNRSVAISQADHDTAVLAFRQSWYQALADVENALSARLQYEDQGGKLAQALEAARTTERLSEARYRAGAVPLKTWLDAQETRRQAENNLAQNRVNRLNALATLYQSLGGGMQSATP
jgi:NodT family efflux transporter outer membrane factor (OMF) lipoprotein